MCVQTPPPLSSTTQRKACSFSKAWVYKYNSEEYFINSNIICISTATSSQDVQTRFPMQLAFAKFLSKIKGNV